MFFNLTGDYNLYVVTNNVRFAQFVLTYLFLLYAKRFYTNTMYRITVITLAMILNDLEGPIALSYLWLAV